MNTTWHTKYRNRPEFLANFDTEQDYVDMMFTLIIMSSYGIWVDKESAVPLATAKPHGLEKD